MCVYHDAIYRLFTVTDKSLVTVIHQLRPDNIKWINSTTFDLFANCTHPDILAPNAAHIKKKIVRGLHEDVSRVLFGSRH